uniref:Aa_trans domain-containing protein n=2 Tax=Bursaphelenchus xylophilus TaxID=6326 RepID=A0A1I7SKM2_BURXY
MTKKDASNNNFALDLSNDSLKKTPVDDGIDYERHPEAKGEVINGEFIKDSGMNWVVAALFLVGDMAGGGIVALPTAVQQCGFVGGIILCIIMALCATVSAVLLGKSWEHLPVRWPEYRLHCRKPYAEIGYRALGHRVK